MIWITGFPLPPSVNEYLMPVAGKWVINKRGKRYQQGRWVKTDIHRAFMDQCYLWRSQHITSFHKIQQAIHKAKKNTEDMGQRFALKVDCYFVFHVERIYTVNNKVERLDADNRLKPCRDALANILELDDKYFFAGSCEKVTTRSKESECSMIRMDQMIPRTMEQIKSQMLQEQKPVT